MAEDHGYSGTSTTTQVPVRNTLVMDHGRYNARLEGRDGVSADGGRRDGRTGAAHLFGCSLASSQSPLNIVKDETAVMAEDEINGFCLKHVVGLEVLPDVDNGAADIISVPGISTVSRSAWDYVEAVDGKATGRKVHWLKDENMLPASLSQKPEY